MGNEYGDWYYFKKPYLFYSYLVDCTYKGSIFDDCVWSRLNPAISNLKISKEEKKMHKKTKIKGHVAHKMTVGANTYFYIVAPERESVEVYAEWQQPPIKYVRVDSVHITPRILGRHGYLQSVLKRINEYLSIDAEVSKHMSDVYDFSSAANKNRFEKWESALGICHDENNNTSKEEKKMTEYYVIDVEMTFSDYKTTATECLQVRQTGNYFEIPFDGPDCSGYRLNRLYERLLDYVNKTKEMFNIAFEKSEICANSVLKITSPYNYISDRANREELCKILAYAVEHREYPYPIGDAGLSKVCFYLRECNNQKIYEQVYSEGINCTIDIAGKVARDGLYFDYIPEPTDIVSLRFENGRLTHFVLAANPDRELKATPGNMPGALYHIYKRDKPFQYVKEVKALVDEIFRKRVRWSNASFITYTLHGLTANRE